MKLRIALLATAFFASPAMAQETYREPPKEITDIVLREPPARVSLSPDGKTILLQHRESLAPVAQLSGNIATVAGMQIVPDNNDFRNVRQSISLSLKDVASGEVRKVAVPEGADISYASWSPDSKLITFKNRTDDGADVMLLDVATAKARKLSEGEANPIHDWTSWLPDGSLLLLAMPENRPPMPERPRTPIGPSIQDAQGGEEAQIRTYTNLLDDPYEESLYEWLTTSQPAILPTDGGPLKRLNMPPRIYTEISSSADGKYLLAEWVERPYSYLVPWSEFPRVTAIFTIEGELVRILDRKPLTDNLPVGGVYAGPRSPRWHATEDALLMWAEAQDGGDPRVETDIRDHLMALAAPFDGEPRLLHATEDRFLGTAVLEGSDDLIVSEYDRDTREARRTFIDVTGNDAPRVWQVRNVQDAYSNPGSFIGTVTERGKGVIMREGNTVFLRGSGATPEGLRPFLRKMDINTFETEQIWRNSGETYEQAIDLLARDGSRFMTYTESPTDPGQYLLRENGNVRSLISYPDPHPELTGIKRELVTYKRKDGVELSAELYLPPNYRQGDKLPVVMIAYPREYNDAETAGQVRDTNYSFTSIGGDSPLFLLTQGYAVMESVAMPVVGDDPETVNDTFIDQIVADAQAAIDFTVERGFGDGHRVGIMGHSYGAFMTANLLAHSDLFRAGIAQSGAYNRTLTPFGFQSERRVFWDAKDVYYNLSPFMAADQINEPLLLVHGADDTNSGTYPIQSERMFAAIKGTGGRARLVMLPYEGHGYRSRESNLHSLAEMIDWFDRYVKNAPPKTE